MSESSISETSSILIKKASGEEEIFQLSKLKQSLINSGASHHIINRILDHIDEWVYHGATTKNIYYQAFRLLQKERTMAALRYKLKQAIMELGPTGYPFEQFIGKLFEKKGYKTEVGVVVEGNCVTHEMDVIATNETAQYLVECKYHKDQGKTVGVQVPLYVRSRVNDIIEKRKQMAAYQGLVFEAWVVTNSRFSSDSIDYGNCSGIHLLAWNYPKGHGLKETIEGLNMFPITILSKLNKKEKQQLLDKGITSCLELFQNPELINDLGLPSKKRHALKKELEDICEK